MDLNSGRGRGNARPRGGRSNILNRLGSSDSMHTSGEDISSNGNRDTQSIRVIIRNFSRKIDAGKVIHWLKKKTNHGFKEVGNWKSIDRGFIFQVRNASDAQIVLRLNGHNYLEGILEISSLKPENFIPDSSIPSVLNRHEVESLLREFIQSRYQPENNMLDLSAVAEVQPLIQVIGRLTTGAWNAIFKQASVVCPNVQTIAFNGNKFKSLYPVQAMSQYLRNVANLSFADNNIQNSDSLSLILGKLPSLRELVMSGNPLASSPSYRVEIASSFPELMFLDMQPVDRSNLPSISRSTTTNATSLKSLLPLEPGSNFFDSDITKQTAEAFVVKYIQQFDSDRQALVDVYAQNSLFSFCLDANIPVACISKPKGPRGRGDFRHGKPHQEQRKLNELDPIFSGSMPGIDSKAPYNWLKHDNNLSNKAKKKTPNTITQFQGPLSIVHQLTQLPPTQHSHPSTYLIDSWQIASPPQLYINTHGRIKLSYDGTIQEIYFDRWFVLVPASPGSKASNSGWPIEIVNDMLTLRARYHDSRTKERIDSKFDSVVPLSILDTGKAADQEPSGLEHLLPQQRSLVLEFSRKSGLNYKFSLMCLEEQNWLADNAWNVFQTAKAENRIPQEAFSGPGSVNVA